MNPRPTKPTTMNNAAKLDKSNSSVMNQRVNEREKRKKVCMIMKEF